MSQRPPIHLLVGSSESAEEGAWKVAPETEKLLHRVYSGRFTRCEPRFPSLHPPPLSIEAQVLLDNSVRDEMADALDRLAVSTRGRVPFAALCGHAPKPTTSLPVFLFDLHSDRRVEQQQLSEFVNSKRELFLLKFSLDIKKEEMIKLEEKAAEEERRLTVCPEGGGLELRLNHWRTIGQPSKYPPLFCPFSWISVPITRPPRSSWRLMPRALISFCAKMTAAL